MTSIKLVPIHPKSKEALEDKPTLAFASEHSILFLGDNDDTGIVDPALSAKVVKIYIKRRKIFAFCLPDGRGTVLLNEVMIERGLRRELHEGNVLSLAGSEGDEYMYRVEGQLDGTATSAVLLAPPTNAETIEITNDTTPTASTAVAAPEPSIPAEVGEEVICAICMEILAEPRTVVPCGHSFCRQCMATQSGTCAECRGPIQNHVTCRPLQNMIEKLIDASQKQAVPIFDREDVESYKLRTGGATASDRVPSRKRRRHTQRTAGPTGRMLQPPGEVFDLTD